MDGRNAGNKLPDSPGHKLHFPLPSERPDRQLLSYFALRPSIEAAAATQPQNPQPPPRPRPFDLPATTSPSSSRRRTPRTHRRPSARILDSAAASARPSVVLSTGNPGHGRSRWRPSQNLPLPHRNVRTRLHAQLPGSKPRHSVVRESTGPNNRTEHVRLADVHPAAMLLRPGHAAEPSRTTTCVDTTVLETRDDRTAVVTVSRRRTDPPPPRGDPDASRDRLGVVVQPMAVVPLEPDGERRSA
ncbi:uncharacterized protein A4U43_C04F8580 [Asparagus officinalis]|uniref:Uncharacterized protein n=1 Tax=Asparagus officinalis TaxID=4686 RepID=A0A5P1F3S4_ASPOF|nr:uncharacterized protein A4U43_C04F8580 [Asparagus officinalis]